ncbi:amino acid ABC transporter permease [Homoserinibacter sp. YIM 151385]|uniref:amino acid ABC transporter permease n=1 Tax=Homoserinibacter sp. YIM 151385 TaxID=2985506 RepID=UPI0022F06F89|nr:amino acid ABC transporter permease [Homoserinibacter sp. YIM 151385]WBU37665.1 amino acid ABC transporter permease [Homoserinibacter sp. YIM 151385]
MSTTAPAATAAPPVDESLPVIRRPRHERWITGLLAAAAVAWIAWGLARNEKLQWATVAQYLFSPRILDGLLVTIQLSLLSIAIAIVVGFLMAMLSRSENPVLRGVARVYVGFFRGLPLLVLLLVTFNLALFAPEIVIGFPPAFGVALDTNSVISGFTASIIGLALHESAFMAEIIRGGFLAVPAGQLEAAQSLGMRRRRAVLRIVAPQAIRVIVPATGNQFIMLLKASAMVAVIGGGELLTVAQRIYGQNFQVIPLLIVVSFWYLVLVLLASGGQHLLERRMARGVAGRPAKAAAAAVEEDAR